MGLLRDKGTVEDADRCAHTIQGSKLTKTVASIISIFMLILLSKRNFII